jgi:hypothetical protein
MSGTWLWIDLPLCALFFLAVCGIPLWMVIKHPDTRPNSDGNGGQHNGLARPPAGSPQPARSAHLARGPQPAPSAHPALSSQS